MAYWMGTRGCDFKEAVGALAGIAGLGGGVTEARPLPKRVVREEEEPVVVEALSGENWLKWERACAELYTDPQEMERWAAWRGLRREVIEWAGRRLLCGRVMMQGEWREAFLIKDVVLSDDAERMLGRSVGWHVRLAPREAGGKAGWRYSNRWGVD